MAKKRKSEREKKKDSKESGSKERLVEATKKTEEMKEQAGEKKGKVPKLKIWTALKKAAAKATTRVVSRSARKSLKKVSKSGSDAVEERHETTEPREKEKEQQRGDHKRAAEDTSLKKKLAQEPLPDPVVTQGVPTRVSVKKDALKAPVTTPSTPHKKVASEEMDAGPGLEGRRPEPLSASTPAATQPAPSKMSVPEPAQVSASAPSTAKPVPSAAAAAPKPKLEERVVPETPAAAASAPPAPTVVNSRRRRAPLAKPAKAQRASVQAPETKADRKAKRKDAAAPAPSSHERPEWDAPHDGHEPAPSGDIDRGYPIPESYGLDRLVAMPRDPQWAFCYWELSGGLMDKVRSEYGTELIDACAWVLRLYRIDEGMAIDMEIEANVGNWYVHVVNSGRYQFELGLLTPNGDFISLLASQVIETPAEGPSDVHDEEWRLRPEDEARLHRMLLEALGMDPDGNKRGTSGFLGASVLPSSWRLPFSFMGASLGGASWGGSLSGRPVAGSWAWSFQGASGMPSSPGGMSSDTLGWLLGADGHHQPVLLRPTNDGGPNWNLQPYLPGGGPSKSQAPHFKVRLPRVLKDLQRPQPSWPAVGARAFGTLSAKPRKKTAPTV